MYNNNQQFGKHWSRRTYLHHVTPQQTPELNQNAHHTTCLIKNKLDPCGQALHGKILKHGEVAKFP
jgi:hypothetical protein